jgi:hypothetical protein
LIVAIVVAHAVLRSSRRVLDHKLYVRGVGTVLEQTVKGGRERNALVSVRRP